MTAISTSNFDFEENQVQIISNVIAIVSFSGKNKRKRVCIADKRQI